MRRSVLLMSAATLLALGAGGAHAQMFGQRQLGGMLSRQNPPGSVANAASAAINTPGGNPGGQITGAERFVRGARQANDFIGTDTGDRRGFVGARQSRLRRAAAALQNLQIRQPPNANQAAPPEPNSPTTMYPPRLVLSPELSGLSLAANHADLEKHLRSSRAIRWTSPLELSIQGRTAILRGAVASERDRELVATLALFEPGISDVQNDLRVELPVPPQPILAAPEPRGPAPLNLPVPAGTDREF